jgi:hypothetical protein
VRTVVLGERPPELEALIARRRQLGLDTFDEVWEGDYHMNAGPSGPHAWIDQQLAEILGPLARRAGLFAGGVFNLGVEEDFRVPDRGIHRSPLVAMWFDTAALVVEIESPDDETWDKLGFYAAHAVDEVLIVSPDRHTVTLLALEEGQYAAARSSGVLGVPVVEMVAAIEWPPLTASDDAAGL